MSKNWDLLSDRENGAIIMIRTVMSCRKFRARRQETHNSNRFDIFTHGFDDIAGNNRFSARLKTVYTGNPGCAVGCHDTGLRQGSEPIKSENVKEPHRSKA